MEYFTVENCTPEQLDELRNAYFYSDDPDLQENLESVNITSPEEIENWMLYQEYARILFTNDDFFCTAG